MSADDQVEITLGVKQRDGIQRPVVHVLTPDGRVTEFKDRAVVIPEDGERVYALLINGKGEVMYTADGVPAMAPLEVVQIGLLPDPDRLIRWKDLEYLTGQSESTVKRLVEDGLLPKAVPVREGGRSVVFREIEVREALRKIVAAKRKG